jgi:hypothetical protein
MTEPLEKLRRRIILVTVLCSLSVAMSACQAEKQAPNAAANPNRSKNPPQTAVSPNPELRSWPGAYPQPTALKGLKSVSVRVYADRGIPPDRIAAGPFAAEIEKLTVEKLKAAGIAVVGEKLANQNQTTVGSQHYPGSC